MPELGVNIDHVATVRQARKTYEPDPVHAAFMAELGGADQITVHLREDRRHIQDRDVELLMKTVQTRVNLEMAVAAPILKLALKWKPACACLVPEKRQEVTTEGGLNVVGAFARVQRVTARLLKARISVSLFIDPDEKQVAAAARTGAPCIELHTGAYANAKTKRTRTRELRTIERAAVQAQSLGLTVHAGHGLNYQNVLSVARIGGMRELNIGHAIVARAVFVGLTQAVREMKDLISA